MDDFSKLKNLYEDGYRCIYHDCVDNNYTIYLKNFYTEGSETIKLSSESDFSQFKDYIDGLRMS
ncbi:putative evolved beta-galactosidase beta-subunit [Clostridioides difficile CD160]|nr:putative evolved beta-galactosidase beta-subunit [Clostridioides difficile CD160]